MTEKQMKHYIIRLYKCKKIYDYQFNKAVNYLEKLRDGDLLFYYFNTGKLHTAFGNAEEAIFYLEKAIMLKPDNSSAYYNLYKCYVRVNNIKKAQINFEKFLEINNKDINFEFVVNIMKAINVIDNNFFKYLEEDFSVEYTSKIGYNNLENNEELKNIYFEVLKAFNTREYLTSIKKLKLMRSRINKIGYPIEVDTLIQLIKYLKDKEIMYYRMCLEDEKYRGISNEAYVNILFHLYELGSYSAKSFLRKIEEIILNDSHIKGDIILDKIANIQNFENYQDMIEYLKGIIREKEVFSLLGEDKQEKFTLKRLDAKSQYRKKQNEKSLESYLALKEEFNLPICDYYIGKIMFRMGDFSKAKEYFLSYLEQGGVKTEKAYMFLAKIEKIKKNYALAKRYTGMMHRVHDTFLREFEYLPDKQYRIIKNNSYIDSDIDSIDVIKNNRMRTIKMKEVDFKDDYSLSVTDFDYVNIEGKLIIIRNLLRCGDIKNAQKLLEKVQQECTPQERPKIKQFQKNKKIYMNQIRNGQS